MTLAAPPERIQPISGDLIAEALQTRQITWRSVIVVVSLKDAIQPRAHPWDRGMPIPKQSLLDRLQLLSKTLLDGPPFHGEPRMVQELDRERSGGLSVVIREDAAEALATAEGAVGKREDIRSRDQAVFKALMMPLSVIMGHDVARPRRRK